MNESLSKVFFLIFCVLVIAASRFYYKNIYVSPSKSLWTGQWAGQIPGLEPFTETQKDYFPQNSVLANVCGYSNNRVTLRVTSKVFPSDFPEIKYLGAKGHYMATFKNKNGPDINAILILNEANNNKEIKVQILNNGKVYKLKDRTFILKKENSIANCGRTFRRR
jgi:hypothetical protein